jgi:hypothetical protein
MSVLEIAPLRRPGSLVLRPAQRLSRGRLDFSTAECEYRVGENEFIYLLVLL